MSGKASKTAEEIVAKPGTIEQALLRLVQISQDRSLSEKRLRTQVRAYAKVALDQLEAAETVEGERAATDVTEDPDAWLHEWSGLPREVRTELVDDRYGLAAAIPLSFVPNSEIIAWRWADGGGYNADHRYSFVNPLEDWAEVEAQGASSVIGCKPLYVHASAKGYKG